MGDTDNDRASCSWEGRGAGWGLRFFFFEWAVLYGIRFFPLRHLVSKPFAPTILTANVKLTDVLELDTEWDRYKATTSQQHCLSGVTTHLLPKHPAALLGARLLSGQFEALGAALHWFDWAPITSRHNHSKTVTWMRFPQTFFPVISEANCIPPITKLMSL